MSPAPANRRTTLGGLLLSLAVLLATPVTFAGAELLGEIASVETLAAASAGSRRDADGELPAQRYVAPSHAVHQVAVSRRRTAADLATLRGHQLINGLSAPLTC